MLAVELTDFDALHAFRGLTPDERLESLFLGQREALREVKGANAWLAELNGTTKTTKVTLEAHLDEHGDAQAGIDYVRLWGGRGTGAILFLLAVLGGIAVTFGLLETLR